MISEFKKTASIKAMERALRTQSPFESMSDEIRKLVSEGVDQKTAMDLLCAVYDSASEDEQEPIREVVDIVSGNCTPSKRIFPDSEWK